LKISELVHPFPAIDHEQNLDKLIHELKHSIFVIFLESLHGMNISLVPQCLQGIAQIEESKVLEWSINMRSRFLHALGHHHSLPKQMEIVLGV
jgi:hypothetical protein